MRYGISESPKQSGETPDSPPAIEHPQSKSVQSMFQNLNFTKNSPFQFGAASQVKNNSPTEFKFPQVDEVDSIRDSLDKFQLNSYQNERALLQKTNETLLAELKALKSEKKRFEPIGAAWEDYANGIQSSKMKLLESENHKYEVELKNKVKQTSELECEVQVLLTRVQKLENEHLKFKNFDTLVEQLKDRDDTIANLRKKHTILTQEFKNAQTPTQIVGGDQVQKISQFYLSTIIHEQQEIAFRCLCCHMIGGKTTIQFKCCSMLMCSPCFKKMPQNQNCPGCRKSHSTGYPRTKMIRNNEIQKLKSILETLKESTVREICKAIDSKYTYERDEEADKLQARENDAVETEEMEEEDIEKHLKGVFIKNLPSDVSEAELQLLEPFMKAVKITIPTTWTNGDEIEISKRDFGFVDFRNREDCLECLVLSRNYRIHGNLIRVVQQKPRNDVPRNRNRRNPSGSPGRRSNFFGRNFLVEMIMAREENNYYDDDFEGSW
jgi:hypothetical protein